MADLVPWQETRLNFLCIFAADHFGNDMFQGWTWSRAHRWPQRQKSEKSISSTGPRHVGRGEQGVWVLWLTLNHPQKLMKEFQTLNHSVCARDGRTRQEIHVICFSTHPHSPNPSMQLGDWISWTSEAKWITLGNGTKTEICAVTDCQYC